MNYYTQTVIEVEKETCFACYFSHIFVPPRPFQFLQGGAAAPYPLGSFSYDGHP